MVIIDGSLLEPWGRLRDVSGRVRAFIREFQRYAGQFFTNWREYDASFTTKLALGVRNRLKATFSLQQCCGNHGQPGC